jgi:shikimate dehydrogenase
MSEWRLAVFGSPIQHSLSPVLHEAGLRAYGLKGRSERVEVGSHEVERVRELLTSTYDAASVTMPLKGAVLGIADQVDPVARECESANSLLRRDGVLEATSTDGAGFVGALASTWSLDVDGAHAVVLGAGGAASALVSALVRAGVSSIALHGRSEERVGRLVARYPNVVDHMVIYRPVDLIINTIPVDGREVAAAVMQGVTPDTAVVDIAYEPRESDWLALHRALGCRTMNGLAMLAHQAAAQMRWWWGGDLSGEDLIGEIT